MMHGCSQAAQHAPRLALCNAHWGGHCRCPVVLQPQVRAAYSSGNPALGVGAGNTPAVIDETADIRMAVSSILISKVGC